LEDRFKKAMEEYPGIEDANCMLVYGYIDKEAGMTLEVLAAGAIVSIVIGSVAVAGVGGFALLWFVIKKKTWAEFLAIFKKG
jgi:hypothetical protein